MSERARTVTSEEIETYHRDGVVCRRGVLSDAWVTLVREAVDDAEERYRRSQPDISQTTARPEPTVGALEPPSPGSVR